MDVNYLHYFFEVAKAGSFTEAARRLRISQSALSKAVALLEFREGVKLLSRSKRGVALTPVGSDIFLKCERLFAVVNEIEAACKGATEVCEGPLNLGASDHITNYLLMSVLGEMQRVYPTVLPRLVAGTPNDILAQILNNEIEFGLFFTKVNSPTIKYEVLLSVPMAVVARPSVVKAGLDKAGFISSPRALNQNRPSAAYMRFLSKEPKVVFECNGQEAQKRYCMTVGGIAYLARFMVEKELHDGTLSEIRMKKKLSVDLHLAKRRGRELSFTARTFLEFLRRPLSV